MGIEDEKQIMEKVLEESLNREISKKLRAEFRHDDSVQAKQPMLLAHPSGWNEKINK